MAPPPSYVMSPNRFTTPIVSTKLKAGDEPRRDLAMTPYPSISPSAGADPSSRRAIGDRRINQFDFERAARRNVQVRHVARMTTPHHDTVVLVARIEVRPRRVERGWLALAH